MNYRTFSIYGVGDKKYIFIWLFHFVCQHPFTDWIFKQWWKKYSDILLK